MLYGNDTKGSGRTYYRQTGKQDLWNIKRNVEYLFTVHEHVFNPPPKVKSAVIRMTRNETKDLGCNEKLFKQIVKTTFNQRRKTLRNSISSILDKENPLSADPIFNKRPEQLSVEEFIELTNRVEKALE